MPQPKLLILLLSMLLLCSTETLYANAIDNLKTDEHVVAFLIKTAPQSGYDPEKIKIELVKQNTFGNGVKTWEKLDFNQDGKTDLLTHIYFYGQPTVYIVIDNGSGNYKGINLSDGDKSLYFVKTIVVDKVPMLILNETNEEEGKSMLDVITTNQKDTLIYKFGGFIEFNRNPPVLKIKAVLYQASRCFGTCPVFTLNIAGDGKATYEAIAYNPQKGDYKGYVGVRTLEKIKAILTYIDIKHVKDGFKPPVTDLPTAYLKIDFEDGTFKTVSDYGMVGTFGLARLYELFANLRTSEKWKLVSLK